jgi:hypothetical protein
MQKYRWRGAKENRTFSHSFLILAAIAIWAAVDLWRPRTTNLRQFDPDDVARRETEMWRSLLRQTNEFASSTRWAGLLRQQYRMPLLRSYVVGFHAAKAAFVFIEGNARNDYEKALPDLQNYYSAIRRISDTPFDIDKASRLELEMVDLSTGSAHLTPQAIWTMHWRNLRVKFTRCRRAVSGTWEVSCRSHDHSG